MGKTKERTSCQAIVFMRISSRKSRVFFIGFELDLSINYARSLVIIWGRDVVLREHGRTHCSLDSTLQGIIILATDCCAQALIFRITDPCYSQLIYLFSICQIIFFSELDWHRLFFISI